MAEECCGTGPATNTSPQGGAAPEQPSHVWQVREPQAAAVGRPELGTQPGARGCRTD
ncbi:hypothetical protein [Streptomyces sp. L-9-10]|uniref:hypothetical protein n=1 Tax=Streptomyces sp. L-9-10 TaxID=1478131 RepID=UPI0013EB55BD|nr:hypothetical protein [Streptomyces sp. L-9-10]